MKPGSTLSLVALAIAVFSTVICLLLSWQLWTNSEDLGLLLKSHQEPTTQQYLARKNTGLAIFWAREYIIDGQQESLDQARQYAQQADSLSSGSDAHLQWLKALDESVLALKSHQSLKDSLVNRRTLADIRLKNSNNLLASAGSSWLEESEKNIGIGSNQTPGQGPTWSPVSDTITFLVLFGVGMMVLLSGGAIISARRIFGRPVNPRVMGSNQGLHPLDPGNPQLVLADLWQDTTAAAMNLSQLNRTMAELKTSTSQTELMVRHINSIATETHLLAVNAALEAARAGGASTGLVELAEEVRTLANRWSKAATETSQLLNESKSQTESGIESAGKATEILARINEVAADMDNQGPNIVPFKETKGPFWIINQLFIKQLRRK